jgi:hypothetical protein
VNDVVNLQLIELCVEGAKIIDLCIEGDKFFEEETGGVYNKAVKGVKMSKGASDHFHVVEMMFMTFRQKVLHSPHQFL